MRYHPDAVKNAYDEIAGSEDSFEKGFSLRNEIPREFIKKYLTSSDIVLDAGGGSGINAIMMARLCKRVTLVDISSKLLELAAGNIQNAGLAEKMEIVKGDITDLMQLGNACFSFVVCVGGTLSYVLEQAPQAIRELVRVARKDAILIIGCDSRYGFVRWFLNQTASESGLETAREILEAGEYQAGENVSARLYTVDELTTLMRAAGCEIIEVGATPILVDSWDQSSYPEENRQQLKEMELKFCTVPELLGMGHHLFCVARKI
jgi:ubiquinone/menaquinone biosynthesis C-methylase UbiE